MLGAVTALRLSDDPGRFRRGAVLRTEEGRALTVDESHDVSPKGLLLRFEEIESREAAEELRGEVLHVLSSERRELVESEFWPEQLEGLAVVSVEGTRLGVVRGVVSGAHQDRLVIELLDRRIVEVPFVDALVPHVSVAEGTLTLVPIEGLLS